MKSIIIILTTILSINMYAIDSTQPIIVDSTNSMSSIISDLTKRLKDLENIVGTVKQKVENGLNILAKQRLGVLVNLLNRWFGKNNISVVKTSNDTEYLFVAIKMTLPKTQVNTGNKRNYRKGVKRIQNKRVYRKPIFKRQSKSTTKKPVNKKPTKDGTVSILDTL